MVKTELLDDHVSLRQCQVAVDALLQHTTKFQEEKQQNELLPGREQHVWLVLTVKQMQPEKKLKPFKIPISHPLVDPRESSVCLITKDPQREYKDLLEKHKIKFIHRVVGITKLKGKFKGYEEKRMLLKENELFLADERVTPLLPGLLGKKFFAAKKQPIPVNLTKKDLKGELEGAISSTYFHQNQGTCSSIKIGVLSQTPGQILANLKTALPAVIKHIKGGWDNVQSLNIKTNSSASLPIWTCDLGTGEGGRWDGLIADEDVEMSGSEEESDDEESGDEDEELAEESEEEELKVKKAAQKGKKRAAEDDAPTSKKKAKSDAEIAHPVAKKPKRTTVAEKATLATDGATKPASDVRSKKPRKDKLTKAGTADTPSGPSSSSASEPKLDGPTQTITESIAALPKKKKRASAAADLVPSDTPASSSKTASASAPTPVTPAPASAKKSQTPRALAADFFDATPATSTSVAPPPPNTPADGLVETPALAGKKKRRGKGVEATPVASALEKLAGDAATPSKQSASPTQVDRSALKSTKKSKKKADPENSAELASPILTKAAKGKKSAVTKPELPTLNSTDLSVEELKQKRSASGVEKKKEKVVKSKPAGKSAKETLLGGKKGLKA